MPDEVLDRLEAGLRGGPPGGRIRLDRIEPGRAEPDRAGRGSADGHPTTANRVPAHRIDLDRTADHSVETIDLSLTGPSTGLISAIGSEKGQPSRLSRMSRPAQRARRQALEEQRADRPSPTRAAAQGRCVGARVVGAGALTLHFSQGRSSNQTTASAPTPVARPR